MRFRVVYWLGYSITRVLGTVLFRAKVRGREHIPRSGGFILASNHISYYDPPLVGSFQRRELYFFAKQELFQNKLFGAIMTATNSLPVRRGTVDRHAIKLALNALKRGFGLTFFPEGTRALEGTFLPPKPGLGWIARLAEVPIVPAYIHGANDLKACFWGKNRLSITYGEPFSADWVRGFPDDKEGYLAISTAVMDRIAGLKERLLSNDTPPG